MKANKLNNILTISIVVLLSLAIKPLYAQNHISRHYTVNDGLPSMVVYDIMQDDKGFVWLATKEGIARFDGNQFRHYTIEHGLSDNEVLCIRKGTNGVIWALPFRNKLAYLLNDTVLLANLALEHKDPVKDIATDNMGHLWVTYSSGKLIGYRNGYMSNIFNPKIYMGAMGLEFNGLSDGYGNVWISSDTFLLKVDTNECVSSWVLKDGLNFVGTMRVPLITTTNDVYLYTRLVVAKLVNDSLRIIFSGDSIGKSLTILNISESQKGILVATSLGAYKVETDAAGKVTYQSYFTDQPISKMLEDAEGNLWFCTLNNGLYKISANSRHIVNIGAQNGLFTSIPGAIFNFNDTVGVSSLFGDVYTITQQEGNWQATPRASNFFLQALGNCQPINNQVWCSSTYGINIYNKGETLDKNKWVGEHRILLNLDTVYTVTKAFDNLIIGTFKQMISDGEKVYACGAQTFKEIDLAPGEPNYKIKRLYNNRTTAIVIANDGALWAAHINGLQQYNGPKATPYPYISTNTNISYMVPNGAAGLWLSTSGRGIYKLNGFDDSLPQNYTVHHGLPSNVVNHLLPTPYGIVVSTDKGLCLLNEDSKGHINIYPASVNDGLLAADVLQTLSKNGELFVLTSKGVSIVDERLLHADSASPITYITLTNISGTDTAVLPQYTLPYSLNNIKLEYIGLLYKANGNLQYRYQMEGVDTGWVQTAFTNVQYPTLPPGKYTFKVDSRSLQGPWSEKPATMQITILPPFWKTWWFRLLVAMLFVGIVTGISYAIIKYYRNQSLTAQRMVELEGQALRANMNPHFVFNALNAIHDFIANQDERSAHLYLGKFAQLIRSILDQSRRNFISLDEELDTLRLYLELENMRFEHKFAYSLVVEDNMQPYDIELPPMLIQPYIENAIRHGLMDLGKPGRIEVAFANEGSNLRCTITDNGIGRAKAMEISSKRLKSHRSAGMEITQKRIELLNHGNQNGEVSITDLYDTHGLASGTKVTLTLPVKAH